ncbi:uncharacterized protein LOC124365935 [Homalodisca vitripennis]|uniref:uncharacterized protein LOC124365935 n=1 Tax=Homalodisca vitripennis TaxID=197043 RepID=UPI001EEA8A03|nr:uncharacterized protein LOC124365935 [Homalodisca vitripennis]
MHQMFQTKYPNAKVSYETYRQCFCSDFNISFGYPRTDTCSKCDELTAKITGLQKQLKNNRESDDVANINKEITSLENEAKLHKIKADVFYKRKTRAKQLCKQSVEHEAISMDFGKNLQLPNITTNDIYYKRQLSMYAFNIHELSSAKSIFYLYPETEGKKGSDDVSSFLHNFVYEHLDEKIRHLHIFCDSCSGQNKNFTMIRFLHYLVYEAKKLDSIKVTFPLRGHSYMECDKNMGLVNTKSKAELPSDWIEVFENARKNPFPFKVVSIDNQFCRQWTKFLDTLYMKKCPFATRTIKELKISKEGNGNEQKLMLRSSYYAAWDKCSILPKKKTHSSTVCAENEFLMPEKSYDGPLPIKKAKYNDLKDLKIFCSSAAQEYFTNLPHLDE